MNCMVEGKRVHCDILHESLLESFHKLELVDGKVNFVLMLDEWLAEDDTDMAYYRCPLNEITGELIEQGYFHDEQGKLQYDESIIIGS